MENLEYRKSIPQTEIYDVVVCGGGPAGIGAAVAAAEGGAKTCLIERFSFLGGMATAGYVNPMSEFAYNGRRISGGIPWRFAQEMVSLGGAMVEEPRCNISFDPEVYKLAAHRMVEEAGVKLYLNSFLTDCVTEGKTVKAAIITNKSGLLAVSGKMFVDATGDADLSAFLGAPMLPQVKDRQPATLCFCLSGVDTTTERMHIIHQKNHRFNHQAMCVRDLLFELREKGVDVPQFGGPWLATTMAEGCITVNLTRAAVDATDNEDLQKADAKMREDVFRLVGYMKEYIPEFKNCHITSIAQTVGIRESRRVEGVHVLTGEEYVRSVHFEDAVARACHPVDIHLPDGEGQKLTFPEDAGYIPFGCLYTKEYPNLLMAGRIISADAEAFAAIRVQVPCMETGQAAGVAAAKCAKDGIAVQQLDPAYVVAKVREYGSVSDNRDVPC